MATKNLKIEKKNKKNDELQNSSLIGKAGTNLQKSLEYTTEIGKNSKIYNHVGKQARKTKTCRHFIQLKRSTKKKDLQKKASKNLNIV